MSTPYTRTSMPWPNWPPARSLRKTSCQKSRHRVWYKKKRTDVAENLYLKCSLPKHARPKEGATWNKPRKREFCSQRSEFLSRVCSAVPCCSQSPRLSLHFFADPGRIFPFGHMYLLLLFRFLVDLSSQPTIMRTWMHQTDLTSLSEDTIKSIVKKDLLSEEQAQSLITKEKNGRGRTRVINFLALQARTARRRRNLKQIEDEGIPLATVWYCLWVCSSASCCALYFF